MKHRKLTLTAGLCALGLLLNSCGNQTAPSPEPQPTLQRAALTSTNPNAFIEEFNTLNPNQWIVSTWSGFWQQQGLTGGFSAQNAYVDGKGNLVLALKIQSCATGLCAQAAEVQSAQRFGYGRYTYRMRTASTSANPTKRGQAKPGNITGAFSYVNDSATEIDLEIEGRTSSTLDTTVWNTHANKSYSLVSTGSNLAQGFHTYAYDWQPGRITYYLDGVKVWETTQNVPTEAAYVMLNVWPTLNANWGGVATAGTVYMLVDSFMFEPS